MQVWTFDNFLKDPMRERELALSREYKTIEHNGLNYRGISLTKDEESLKKIENLVDVSFIKSIVMYRRYLEKEVNETYIHSDVHIGTFTGILFLNLDEQCQGGTAFWKHKKYGFEYHPFKEELEERKISEEGLWQEIYKDGFDEKKWQLTQFIPMKFNRFILFWSPRYHSRYPMQAFGDEITDSRLVKVFFCQVKVPG